MVTANIAGQEGDGSPRPAASKAPRRLARLLAALLALAALAWMVLPALLIPALEEGGRRLLGVEVHVGGLSWSLDPVEVRLDDVRVSSPGGAAHPLATAVSASVRLEPGQRPWSGGTLGIAEIRVRGLELASAAQGAGSSSLAEVQRHVRGVEADRHAAEPASSPFWNRVELGLLRVDGAGLEANGADGTLVAGVRLGAFEARNVLVPIPAVEGREASAELFIDDLEVSAPTVGGEATLLGAAHAEAAMRGGLAAGAADAVVLDVPRLEASGVAATVRLDDRGAFELAAFWDAWQAALAGLDLPGVAAASVGSAVIRADRIEVARPREPRLVPLAATTVKVRDYSTGRPRTVAPVVELETSPFEATASLRVVVTGTTEAGSGPREAGAPRGPVRIEAQASRVPVHAFPELYLKRGFATARTALRVEEGVVRGPVTLRLDATDVAPGAPIRMKTAYAALAASRSPELTVPLEVRLSHPDTGAIVLAVTTALLERAGRDVGSSLGSAAHGLGSAAEGVGGAAEGVGRRVEQGWKRLVR